MTSKSAEWESLGLSAGMRFFDFEWHIFTITSGLWIKIVVRVLRDEKREHGRPSLCVDLRLQDQR